MQQLMKSLVIFTLAVFATADEPRPSYGEYKEQQKNLNAKTDAKAAEQAKTAAVDEVSSPKNLVRSMKRSMTIYSHGVDANKAVEESGSWLEKGVHAAMALTSEGELTQVPSSSPKSSPSYSLLQATQPSSPGCYFKQDAGNGKCYGGASWTPDNWGKKNANSYSSESKCLGRKGGHDKYCGTNSQWTYVQAPSSSPPASKATCDEYQGSCPNGPIDNAAGRECIDTTCADSSDNTRRCCKDEEVTVQGRTYNKPPGGSENCGASMNLEARYCSGKYDKRPDDDGNISPDGLCIYNKLRVGDKLPLTIKVQNKASYDNMFGDPIYIPAKIEAGTRFQIAFHFKIKLPERVLSYDRVPVLRINGVDHQGTFTPGPADDFKGLENCKSADECGYFTVGSDINIGGDSRQEIGTIIFTVDQAVEKIATSVAADNGALETVGGICRPRELTAEADTTCQVEFAVAPR